MDLKPPKEDGGWMGALFLRALEVVANRGMTALFLRLATVLACVALVTLIVAKYAP